MTNSCGELIQRLRRSLGDILYCTYEERKTSLKTSDMDCFTITVKEDDPPRLQEEPPQLFGEPLWLQG